MSLEGKTMVVVSQANQMSTQRKIADIIDWEPTKVSFIGTSAYFKVIDIDEEEDTFYSMDSMEFRELFGHKLNR